MASTSLPTLQIDKAGQCETRARVLYDSSAPETVILCRIQMCNEDGEQVSLLLYPGGANAKHAVLVNNSPSLGMLVTDPTYLPDVMDIPLDQYLQLLSTVYEDGVTCARISWENQWCSAGSLFIDIHDVNRQ